MTSLAASESSHRLSVHGVLDESNLTIYDELYDIMKDKSSSESIVSYVSCGLVDFGHSRRKFWQWICAFTSDSQADRGW